MCAAFSLTFSGKVRQNRGWDRARSPGKQLPLPVRSEHIYLGAHLNSLASRWDWYVVYLSQGFEQLLCFQLTG